MSKVVRFGCRLRLLTAYGDPFGSVFDIQRRGLDIPLFYSAAGRLVASNPPSTNSTDPHT